VTTVAPTLAKRRTEREAELAVLERAQAVAVLDGDAFDASRLIECRLELAALDGAEAEAVRRERAAESAEKAQERAEARKGLSDSLEAYLAAVERAEASAKAMVADLVLVETLADAMRGQCRVVGGAMLPIPLEQNDTRLKLSAMLVTQLAPLGVRNRIGCMEWSSVAPMPDWPATARKYVGGALKPFIEE
jgi:hypothetical protein